MQKFLAVDLKMGRKDGTKRWDAKAALIIGTQARRKGDMQKMGPTGGPQR